MALAKSAIVEIQMTLPVNVVYVDSHDYGPGSKGLRFGGSDAQWAENPLMFTFRGIPCLYYGSEVGFRRMLWIDIRVPMVLFLKLVVLTSVVISQVM